ncbi:hypothetical protein DSO57_1031394 [Entomophthora muscae]|uniref:Uncharacterized protein n=1 Tax=Entomophthora muscae TaxID=34485 RepID=A0ACC2U9Q0_9FUNG|nr:hypothetical protein DSO57_1031394 [Entomophthora muscae]
MSSLVKSTEEMIHYACDMELNFPATWNPDHLLEIQEDCHESIEDPLNQDNLKEFNDAPEEKINEALSSLARVGINATKNVLPLIVAKLFDTKVRLIFEISAAYYRVAQLRFGDNIPLIIYQSLVLKLTKSVESFLVQELRILDEDAGYIAEMITDDPAIVSKRTECNDRLKRLREVRKNIFS